MNVDIQINILENANLDKVEQLVNDFPEYLKDNLFVTLSPVADIVVNEARQGCPVKTGALRNSIQAVVNDDGIEIVATVNYASFQEYGTVYIPAKSFMLNSLINHYQDIRLAIENVIKDYFRDVAI